MNNLFRELKTSSLFQIPFFACLGALMFALAAWLLRHLCLTQWFYGSLCLALALASWAAIHPLDYFLRNNRNLDLSVSAKIAFGNAISVTLLSVALFLRLLNLPSPRCALNIQSSSSPPKLPEQKQTIRIPQPAVDSTSTGTLEWRKWHAALWDTMFLNVKHPSEVLVGTRVDYSFRVNRNRQITHVVAESANPTYREFVLSRIQALSGTDVLEMPRGSARDVVVHKNNVTMCTMGMEGCGVPSTGYKDDEQIIISR